MRRSSTQSPSDGSATSPRNRPNAAPTSVTTSNALWWVRKIGNARALSHSDRNDGRSSSTRPICASARANATGDGGNRFDRPAPGTPTALAGYPLCSNRTMPSTPDTSSAAPHERRFPCSATRTPTCHGTHHTARTFTQPRSNTTTTAGTTTPHQPDPRIRGVRASSATYTTRNHSGVTTRYPTVSTVCCGSPRIDSPKRTAAQPPSNTATGATSRRARRVHGVRDRAAANPPVKKNSPSVWKIQLAHVSSGTHRNGLSTTNAPSTGTTDVTSQCPSTTPAMASARTASITGSRAVTAAHPPRSGPTPATTPCRV